MKRQIVSFALTAAIAVGVAISPALAEKASTPKTAAGLAAAEQGDFKTAFVLFNRQAASGDAEAQFELGMLYALGKGVEKDYVAAYMWTEIAARAKEPYADFIRDEVAANMTPNEISEARRRVKDWMHKNGK